MSNEKVGAIKTSTNPISNITTYSRVHRGIDLPYDFMSKEEKQMLNGEVVTYHIDEVKE